MVHAVGAHDVAFVTHILDVQRHRGRVIDLVGAQQVHTGIFRRIDAVVTTTGTALITAPRLGHIIDAAAHSQLRQQTIGGEQAGRMFRRIGQLLAHSSIIESATNQFGIHPSIATEHLPLVGDVTGSRQLDTLHLDLARLLIDIRCGQDLGVLAGQLEGGNAE